MQQVFKKIAFVVPRYEEGLGGGAETLIGSLARNYAEFLQANNLDSKDYVHIITTTSVDHRTWEAKYPEGDSFEHGIKISRFNISSRDLEKFIPFELNLQNGIIGDWHHQLDWLKNGVNSSSLYNYLLDCRERYDHFIFAPYLFSISFFGTLIVGDKSILLPCLHDEPYAYLNLIKFLHVKAGKIIFNAGAEADLAYRLYGKELEQKSHVVGMEIPDLKTEKSSDFKMQKNSYILYSGRKERGKNLDFLIDSFVSIRSELVKRAGIDLKLVIIGSGKIDFLDSMPEGVIDLGFVSEQEKFSLMKDSLALIQPSTNESFSIVIMESWIQETPVIVHADCAVTLSHVSQSKGGLSFANSEQLMSEILKLSENLELRDSMGLSGRNFVLSNYSKAAVTDRFIAAVSY